MIYCSTNKDSSQHLFYDVSFTKYRSKGHCDQPCQWRKTGTQSPSDTGCSWWWWRHSQWPSSTPVTGPGDYQGHFHCRRSPGRHPPWAAAGKPSPGTDTSEGFTLQTILKVWPTELAAQLYGITVWEIGIPCYFFVKPSNTQNRGLS